MREISPPTADRTWATTGNGLPEMNSSMRNQSQNPDHSERNVSEARFAGLLETAMDGIIVYNEKTRILVFNKTCESIFGYRFHEIIGLDFDTLVYSENADSRSLAGFRNLPADAKAKATEQEILGRHKDGTAIPLEISVGETFTPTGRQFIAIVRDIRPRKAVEEQVNQLQAQLVHMARVNAMNDMGGAIAHELNQPLTAAVLYLQTALRQLTGQASIRPDDKVTELLIKAEREAKRAGSIIQSMRQFIQKREPAMSATDIRSLLDDAIELTLMGSSANNVRIERIDDGSACMATVDAVQIEQVFVNLIRNAIHAIRSQPDPEIRVRVTSDSDMVTAEIQDSGPGIRPEIMATLFKAFSSDKRDGLGMGLAISRTIAQNHHGDLKAIPGGEGQGAKFILTIPAVSSA